MKNTVGYERRSSRPGKWWTPFGGAERYHAPGEGLLCGGPGRATFRVGGFSYEFPGGVQYELCYSYIHSPGKRFAIVWCA